MSRMGWDFFRKLTNKQKTNQHNMQSNSKKWDVAIAVFEGGNDSIPTRLNFHDVEAERINVCFKDKYLIISELTEMQGLDINQEEYILEDFNKRSFEKIIGFPRTIKKVAFSAIQNID